MPFVVGRSILQRVTPLAGCTVLCPTARPAWMRASLSSQGHVRTVPGRALEAGAERNCGHARLRAGASMPCNLDGGTEWFLRAEFQGSTAGQGDLRVGGVGRAVRVRGDGSCRSDSSEQLRRSQPWPQRGERPQRTTAGRPARPADRNLRRDIGYWIGSVISWNTFSQPLGPGWPLGWIVAPPEVIAKPVQREQGADLHTSTFGQMVAREVARDNFLDEHVNRRSTSK